MVAFYGVSPDIYQGWIESYLEKAENQTKLQEFREQLRKLALNLRDPMSKDFTRDDCLDYVKKLHTKMDVAKSDLLLRQARNMKKDFEVPRALFAH